MIFFFDVPRLLLLSAEESWWNRSEQANMAHVKKHKSNGAALLSTHFLQDTVQSTFYLLAHMILKIILWNRDDVDKV